MTSTSTDSGTSSESASSEESVTVSSVPVTMEMRPPMSHAGPSSVQRSAIEMQLIAQASDTLVSCIGTYSHRMTSCQTAYFYSHARSLIDQAIQKKTMRSLKSSSLDRTLSCMMSDTGSVVGSAVGLRYPPSVNQTLRVPSVVSETSHYPHTRRTPHDPAPVHSESSSGYSSVLPDYSFRFKVNPAPQERSQSHKTLLQAIDEVDVDSEEETTRGGKGPSRKKRNSNPPTRKPEKARKEQSQKDSGSSSRQPETSTPSSSDSDGDESDEPSPPKAAKTKPKETAKTSAKTPVTKVIKLREWRLRVVGEEMIIAGYAPDRSRAISGPIKRYSHPVIIAENGEYTVEGPPHISTTAPKYLPSYCKNGFPRQWKVLTKRWIADISTKDKKKSTPKAKNRKDESKASNQGSSKNDKKKSTPQVKNRKDQSKASNEGSAKNAKKPRPSASSTPKAKEKTQGTKGNTPASKPRKRLSKSADKSASVTREKQGKVVKPRTKSEARLEKKPKEVRPVENLEGERPTRNLFDDDSSGSGEDNDDYQIGPFVNIGGDERVSLGKMTPNSLMKSIQPDVLDLGRHTPPMTGIQHLFESGTKSLASTGSPSSLNVSRDNPVAKRVNKDLVEVKKSKSKKKKPTADVENRDPRMDEAIKFLKPSQHNLNMRTPNIVKKVFHHQPSEDDTDEEDCDESMAF